MVLLSTSTRKGDCFIETKNLDGETNLKPKYAPATLGKMFRGLASREVPPDT
jgi:magnesium-transporting ATPase (P-type)